MVLELIGLADANIERLVEDPPLVWRVVAPDEPDFYDDERRRHANSSLLDRLFRKRNDEPADAIDLRLGDHEGARTDLDKAWHGIHYLLTKTADAAIQPWSFLVSGGQAVGDVEVGYGPARVFTSAKTRAICEAVLSLTDIDLRSRFDPFDMTEQKIYPAIWSRGSPDEDAIGYLLEHYAELREFLRQTVESKVGIVVILT